MNSTLLSEIRRRGEGFLHDLNRHVYLTSSGLGNNSSFREIYNSYGGMFEPSDFVDSLKEESAESPEEQTGKKLIFSFLSEHVIGRKTAGLLDEIASLECERGIRLGGRLLSLRDCLIAIELEPKRGVRDEIAEKTAPVMEKINQSMLKTLDIRRSTAHDLGYDGLIGMADETGSLELGHLRTEAEAFLKDTEYVYSDLLRWMLSRRLPIKEPKRHDIDFLLNSFEFTDYFGSGNLLPTMERFLAEMGAGHSKNIRCDLEARANKLKTVEAVPIDPPREAAFAIYPLGSVEDYGSFLSQTGKALSFAFVPEDDLFEFRFLRDRTYMELFGTLFANLILEPTWAKRYMRLDVTPNLSVPLAFRRLARIRLTAAGLIYSLELHGDEGAAPRPEAYMEAMDNALLCSHDPALYLIANEADIFGAAHRFRALMLEPSISAHMKERFDEQWWRVLETMGYLGGLWEAGGRTTYEDLAKEVGVEKLESRPVMDYFEKALG